MKQLLDDDVKIAAPKLKKLAVEQAKRAIYIDFEGTQKDPPSFLGAAWLEDGEVRMNQWVVEPQLFSAAAVSNEKYGHVQPAVWSDLVFLRSLAVAEERLIIAWSDYDRTQLADHMPDRDDRVWFGENVFDGKHLAKRWKSRAHPDVEFERVPRRGKHRLECYLDLIGYAVPVALGSGNSAKRIRDVREMLDRRGSYSELTTTVKGKWTKARGHNWHDCVGLRTLMIACSRDLAKPDR